MIPRGFFRFWKRFVKLHILYLIFSVLALSLTACSHPSRTDYSAEAWEQDLRQLEDYVSRYYANLEVALGSCPHPR